MRHFLFVLAIAFSTVKFSTQNISDAFFKISTGSKNITKLLNEFTDDAIIYMCSEIVVPRQLINVLLLVDRSDGRFSSSKRCSTPEGASIALCEYKAKGYGIFLKFTGIERYDENGHGRSHILIQDCKVPMFYKLEPYEVKRYTSSPQVDNSTENGVTNSTEAYPELPSSTYVPQ